MNEVPLLLFLLLFLLSESARDRSITIHTVPSKGRKGGGGEEHTSPPCPVPSIPYLSVPNAFSEKNRWSVRSYVEEQGT